MDRAPTRRTFLSTLAVAPALVATYPARLLAAPPAEEETEFRAEAVETEARAEAVQAALRSERGTTIVLLGTGAGPALGRPRKMTSVALVHDGATYILDCGLGVSDRLAQSGIGLDTIRAVFLTHQHPDHNLEYGPLLILAWMRNLRTDFVAYGPTSLTQMTEDYLKAMKSTIQFWSEDFHIKPLESVKTLEQSNAGPVMRDGNVEVTSMLVQHPPVRPAFGYRFKFSDRTVVFSGDTVGLEAMATFAKGADVLVHEAMYLPGVEREGRMQIANGMPITIKSFMDHMLASHTPIEEVGRIAQAAGVKTLALYHLAPSLGVTDDEWRNAAAKHFKGEIIVGHDLTVI